MIEDQLPPSLLAALAAHGNTRAFRAQTILLNEGDSGGSLYIVLDGRLRAYASSPEGRDVILSEHGPGEYVGELSLDGTTRSASVKTLEPTTCCVVQAAQLPAFLAEHPEFALHLTQKLTRMYLMQVKSPDKSTEPWDYYNIVETFKGESAWTNRSESKCALWK